VFVEGGFGKVLLGNHNNGTALLHVTAPDAAGNWNGDGLMQTATVVNHPTNVLSVPYLNPGNTPAPARNGLTTAIITDNKAEKITYVAPSFYGLTVGASYVPNLTEDQRAPVTANQQAAGAGALYANTFGGVGLKLSAGAVTYDINPADAKSKPVDRSWEYAFGGQVSYAGFTLGSSYKKVSTNFEAMGTGTTSNSNAGDDSTLDLSGYAFDVGLQYANGPYAVSAAYFKSSVEGTRTVSGTDDIELYQVSGKYNLGPGVDLLGSVAHIKYSDETSADANNNKGWGVMTGLSLSF
jgi:outer membrane protein OmpU